MLPVAVVLSGKPWSCGMQQFSSCHTAQRSTINISDSACYPRSCSSAASRSKRGTKTWSHGEDQAFGSQKG
ncbi:hypothetical protein TNCV_3939801 [Trichonephila clavipes]|uniref:Uncharacterized protein n=1 Tax=Trichonephila clavipes TaxID=2585209 RepID=A0A8X7B9S5_TRICX|nr:hypothetical protein TNCV_3939801 [Trichonephila clavipes]